MSTGNSSELLSFYEYLGQHLHTSQSEVSPEELLRTWRSREETEQVVSDVEQGRADYEAGRGVSVEQAFANVREKLGRAQ